MGINRISARDVQLSSVSVEAKNIAWLTQERSFASEQGFEIGKSGSGRAR